jgi:two-component system KDP operon response regulator KdpE
MWHFHKKNILIVDDDQDLLIGLTIRLRAAGYWTTVAPDAGAALRGAIAHDPDLILLDLGLPGRDGLAVLQRLKEAPSTALTPVIILTARDAVQEAEVLRAGALALFQKPVDDDELLAAIASGLAESQTPAIA